MLWKKERSKRNMVYVNLFQLPGNDLYTACNRVYTEVVLNVNEASAKKDEELSDLARITAIGMIEMDAKPEKILEQINEALCFAKINSVQSGLAYGIRAEYFHQVKQYSFSLVDIEMAKKHKIPSRNRSSLEKIKADCLKSLESRQESSLVKIPKLSFPIDAKIPCFAQCLKVKYSTTFGHHVVTNRKLEIGQTVIIEEAFCIRAENTQNYLQCANCFARGANLMPCKNCAAVMFCSQNCYDVGHENFHAMECGKRGVHTSWEAARRIVMQTVIKAIQMFPKIEDLMVVLEKVMTGDMVDKCIEDPSIRAYLKFFRLGMSINHTPGLQDQQFVDYTKTIHSEISTSSQFKSRFGILETSRFLAHLIMHHFYVVDKNGFDALNLTHGTDTIELGLDSEHRSGFTYAHGIYLNSSRLNHSCQPNIARIFIGNKLIGKVIRPIKPGEQLFVTYLNPYNLLKPLEYRRERLATIYYFSCTCKSCTSKFPPFETSAAAHADDSIRTLLGIFQYSRFLAVNRSESLKFENAAIKFLQNNDHLHPTPETLLIQFVLMQIWNNLGR